MGEWVSLVAGRGKQGEPRWLVLWVLVWPRAWAGGCSLRCCSCEWLLGKILPLKKDLTKMKQLGHLSWLRVLSHKHTFNFSRGQRGDRCDL